MATDASATATLVIAVVGLVLSVASLVWQATTFRLSGPRVRVELLIGAVSRNGFATAPLGSGWQRSLEQLQANGLPTAVLAVRVRNVGRQATSVERYEAAFNNRASYSLTVPPPGCPSLPYRLEAEAQAVWWLPLEDVAQFVVRSQNVLSKPMTAAAMRIELGSGRKYQTEQRVTLDELRSWLSSRT